MTQRFAKFLSYALHPAIIPTVSAAFLLWVIPMYISKNVFYYTVSFIAISTYLMPGLFSIFLKRIGLVKSLHMSDPRDRKYPFLVSIGFFLFSANALRQWPIPMELVALLISSAITIFIFYLLLRWSKWSVHLAGMGGLTALIIYTSRTYEVELLNWIALSIALSGLLATARLKLSAHTPLQVLAGFCTGLLVTFACLVIISTRI